MIKRHIILLLSLLFTVAVQAKSVEDMFLSIPAHLLPGITEGEKTFLLVDKGETFVPYTFGEIRKVKQGNDYIKVETSERGTLQLKMLPVSTDSSIVSVIKTACGGFETNVCDSYISFYTTDWEKLNSDAFLQDISAETFFDSSQKGSDSYKYALSLSDIDPISAEYNEDNTDLLLTFNYKEYLSASQAAEIAPFLKSDSLTLSWEETCFR